MQNLELITKIKQKDNDEESTQLIHDITTKIIREKWSIRGTMKVLILQNIYDCNIYKKVVANPVAERYQNSKLSSKT